MIDESKIISTLNSLGIKHSDKPNTGNWLSIICPFHEDKNLNSSFIHLETSIFKCHACGAPPTNIIGIVKHVTRCNYKSALEFIGLEIEDYPGKRESSEKEEEEKLPSISYNLDLEDLGEESSYPPYLKDRGFTKEFCDYFNIKQCKNSWYLGYIIIPILEANTFEARKIFERDTICQMRHELFNGDDDSWFKDYYLTSLPDLRDWYYSWRNKNKNIDNKYTIYMDKSKTLYPKHSLRDKPVIFNQNRLNRNEDLYITEGIAGIPKIWAHITKNITATFGSEISKKQINILNEFKGRKIVIPEAPVDRNQTTASDKMISILYKNVDNIWVIPVAEQDTSTRFIEDFRDNMENLIEGSRYIIRKKIPLW